MKKNIKAELKATKDNLAYAQKEISRLTETIENIGHTLIPSRNYINASEVLNEISELVAYKARHQGTLLAEREEIFRLQEIIRWLINKDTAVKQMPENHRDMVK